MIRLSGRHWLAALATAMTIHVGVLLGLLWQMPDPGAKSAGLGGIDVSLGPVGGGAPASSEADPVSREEPSPEPPPKPSPPVKTQEPVTKPEPKPEVVERVPEEPPPEPVPEEPVPEVSEVKPQERIPEPRPPVVEPAPQPTPRETAEATSDAATERTALTSSTRPTEGEPRQEATSGDASSGGGSPGAVADYASLIRAWLERHKEYPRRARLRRLEGTATLYFVMDRKGRVLKYRIQRSAGSSILDRAVEAMIERAKPLPEMPDDMHQARLELIVPVTFSLR